MRAELKKAIKVFYCYAREDEELREQLEKQLSVLKRHGLIETWNDREISAGQNWNDEINKQLKAANIVLLLISPDFMDSDYCFGVELKQAMQRHRRKEVLVIPIILRPIDLEAAPFSKLQFLPRDGRAVTKWDNIDEAFADIAIGIRKSIEKHNTRSSNDGLANGDIADEYVAPEDSQPPRFTRRGFIPTYTLNQEGNASIRRASRSSLHPRKPSESPKKTIPLNMKSIVKLLLIYIMGIFSLVVTYEIFVISLPLNIIEIYIQNYYYLLYLLEVYTLLFFSITSFIRFRKR